MHSPTIPAQDKESSPSSVLLWSHSEYLTYPSSDPVIARIEVESPVMVPVGTILVLCISWPWKAVVTAFESKDFPVASPCVLGTSCCT